jgi:hypothetical protein
MLSEQIPSVADLDQLAAEIRSHHEAIVAAARSMVLHAIYAGARLKEARARVGHKNWLPWLKRNCPAVRERMAQYYKRLSTLAEAHPEEIPAVTDMTILGAIQYLEQLALPAPKSAMIADLPVVEPPQNPPPSLGLTGGRESVRDQHVAFWNAVWLLGDAIESGTAPPIDGWREYVEPDQLAAIIAHLQGMR